MSATVSNLGRCPLTLDGRPVPAFFLPPASPGMPLFLGLVGDQTGIECCAVAPSALVDAEGLDDLMARLGDQYLQS